jgi:putative ABC transport system permease protein
VNCDASSWAACPNQGRNLLPHVQTFQEFFILTKEIPIYQAMWGAVAFVLLIACANLANLTLARAMERGREISIRVALGAGRWRIVRQLLIESVLLTTAGSAAGRWIAEWGVRLYRAADRGPRRSSWRILDYSMDYRVLGYLAAISVASALFFGLMPARRLSRLNVAAALKDGGRGAMGGVRTSRLVSLLVVGQMALAVVLLTGAGVMIRSFLKIYTSDLGVVTGNVLTMEVNLPKQAYAVPGARLSYYDRVKASLEAIPGVDSVSIARTLPGGSSSKAPGEFAENIGQTSSQPTVASMVVGPGYFRTMRARILGGRDFSDADGPATVPVAVVNERFARTYWPGDDPLDKRVRLMEGSNPGPWLSVMGVASNIAQDG